MPSRPRNVLIYGLDGSLPNLALMRIAGHHRAAGDRVEFRPVRTEGGIGRTLFDRPFDLVYAGLIFNKTRPLAERLRAEYRRAIIGGTGWDVGLSLETVGIMHDTPPDYSIYPNFPHSIGFTQRGCRLKCSFCVVPLKEGAIRPVGPVESIWRGEPHPRNVILLDNDFFGQDEWPERIAEIRAGGFRVSFCQGINARFLTAETAAAIASVDYFDADFRKRRLYTAWDNKRDESRLFVGLEHLRSAGVPPGRVMVYVLVGYDHAAKAGTGVITDDDVYRINRLRAWGADPYPMPFVRTRETIGFQRWVCRFAEKKGVAWAQYAAAGFRSHASAV
jgi:hypothetical protein